ncbi:MAG: hypothetical protein JST00_44280 [Deltaproteobacteria bacterium]|nr:hypothetical protein [Deltaproteobacteria bacterium]
MSTRLAACALLGVALVAGCTSRRIVPLLSSAGIPITRTPAGGVPLEVVTRSTSVRDPLPLSGSGVVYGDFEAALGSAVSSAAVPWAVANRDRRPGGWQLFVEVIQAEADHDGSRMLVTIGVRATLRTRVGGEHIGQTETACRDGGLVPPEQGAEVLYRCMMRIGRDLTSWLAAADPERHVPAPGDDPPRELGGAVGNSGSFPDTDGDGDSDSPGDND